MSDMAVPLVGKVQPRTWRDAITPAGRTSRRRWTLAYAGLLCFGAVYAGVGGSEEGGAETLAVVALFVVFGMLRRGTRRTVVQGNVNVITSVTVLRAQTLMELALWAALWAIFLPTGVLAWREPDALAADPGEPTFGISETARDALLGAALAAGLALGLLQDDDVIPLLPLVGVLMLLSGFARRAAGQPQVQASTLWRVAAALVLAAALAAALLLGVGGGDSP